MKISLFAMGLLVVLGCGSESKNPGPSGQQENGSVQNVAEIGNTLTFRHRRVADKGCQNTSLQVVIAEGEDKENSPSVLKENICTSPKATHLKTGEIQFANGTTFLYEIIAASKKECPHGGLLLKLWDDKDLDKSISKDNDTHVLSLPSCHGRNGEDGAGAGIETTRFDTHENCPAGGILVKTWQDNDNNGRYDEKADQDYQEDLICDGEDLRSDLSAQYRDGGHQFLFDLNQYQYISPVTKRSLREMGQFIKFSTESYNFMVMQPLYYQCSNKDKVETLSMAKAKEIVIAGSNPFLKKLRARQQKARNQYTQAQKQKESALRTLADLKRLDKEVAKNVRVARKHLKVKNQEKSAAAALLAQKKTEKQQVESKLQRAQENSRLQSSRLSTFTTQRQKLEKNEKLEQTHLRTLKAELADAKRQLQKTLAAIGDAQNVMISMKENILDKSKELKILNERLKDKDNGYFKRRKIKKAIESAQKDLMNMISEKNVLNDKLQVYATTATSDRDALRQAEGKVSAAGQKWQGTVARLKATKAEIKSTDAAIKDLHVTIKALDQNKEALTLVLRDLETTLSSLGHEIKATEKRISTSLAKREEIQRQNQKWTKTAKQATKTIAAQHKIVAQTTASIGDMIAKRQAFGQERKFTYTQQDGQLELREIEPGSSAFQLKVFDEAPEHSPMACVLLPHLVL